MKETISLGTILKSITDLRSDMNNRFDLVDQRFSLVDKKFEKMDQRFSSIDKRFDGIDQRFDRLETKVDRIDECLDEVAVYAVKTHEIVQKLSSIPPKVRRSYQHA